MCKRFVQCLALLAFAALVTMTWVSGAAAQVIPISTCMTLGTFGATYNLTANIFAGPGDCLVVAANRITINLKGFCIFGSGSGAGISDAGVARDQTVVNGAPPPGPPVDNGCVESFDTGIDLLASMRSTIRNIEVSKNDFAGMLLGGQSTVKACEVDKNGVVGIVIGDRGTVQDCVVGADLEVDSIGCPDGNGIAGIVAANVATFTLGQNMVITRNLTLCNGAIGIATGDFSTVSFNNASVNGISGIFAGHHTTVTGNTASANGFLCATPPCDDHIGISVGMFSTASNNTADFNAEDGMGVGAHSTVTGNNTDGNAEHGLTVDCPGTPPSGGTVANNQSSGNGTGDYEFDGTGCVLSNNT